MDMQAEKYSLIEYITQIKDIKIVEQLKQFVKANEKDFWNELSEEQQKEIEQGIDELNSGKSASYTQFMSTHRK